MGSARLAGTRRLTSLLQQTTDPLVVLDGRRRVVFVNRAWEELTGFPAGEVVGQECPVQGPNGEPDLPGLLGSFAPPPEALNGQPAGGSTLIVRRDGERLWRRVEYWPLREPRGSVAGLVGIVRSRDAAPLTADSEVQWLRAELEQVRDRMRGRHGFDALIGQGLAHRRLLDQIGAAASTKVPVLVVGEPGTGRRLTARTIHHEGPEGRAPLVPFDCAALPAEALERELFGRDRNAAGRAEAVNGFAFPAGATLLLVEVLEITRDLQARVAAALDAGIRVLATTTMDPEAARRQDRLRPDLYYALTTQVIRLSPLRERLEELPLLAQHFLDRANRRGERRLAGFGPGVMRILTSYDWPGNLRELARVIDVAHAQARGDLIEPVDLPAAIQGQLGAAFNPPPMPAPATPLDATLTQIERHLIELALQHARQNKSRAAEILDISRPRLYRRIKELNIPDEPEPGWEPAAEAMPPPEQEPS